jgi:hypothetical protein
MLQVQTGGGVPILGVCGLGIRRTECTDVRERLELLHKAFILCRAITAHSDRPAFPMIGSSICRCEPPLLFDFR